MNAKPITDKAGRLFPVEVIELGGGFRLRALGRREVACANCLPGEAGTLRLMDLRVEEGTDPGKFTWRNLLRPPVLLPLRKAGIGHQLLARVFDVARHKGFHRLCGDIAPIDLQGNPELPDWYRRQGFAVERGGQFGEWTIARGL